MTNTLQFPKDLTSADNKSLARIISIIENESGGYEEILHSVKPDQAIPVIGITGAPGAGKSSLINALLKELTANEKKYLKGRGIAVLAIDPTSPFSHGALLGDRLRMSEHFNHPKVFIRSLATRGSLGGLSAKTMEVTDLLRAAGFDYIFIETVGVGQSEVEIASLAETTIVVFVPESGDEVQTIKAGIMEIADIFVVNKADREGADRIIKNIKSSLHLRAQSDWEIPVIKTIATQTEGVLQLLKKINEHHQFPQKQKNKQLIFEKAWRLMRDYKMKEVDKDDLKIKLEEAQKKKDFNLYAFVKDFFDT
ncbi:MAG TPA: methylmalonyl Co-A mutase-associated GTPase MeaB [Bacteroidia bacterium]|nr:methylmalonyl Co-A mutase-associated GTPase MeaB [Bacteroidia bacterium]